MVMFNSFLSVYPRDPKGNYGEISPRKVGTARQVWKSHRTWLAPVQAPILLRPGAKRHPTEPVEKGRIHRGGTTESQRFSRAKNVKIWPIKMGGSKFCRNGSLFHQKLGFAICVRRLLNIKLCEMVHPQLHEDITLYGTHYCRRKSGRRNWIPTQQN